jgi:hypothetical protein
MKRYKYSLRHNWNTDMAVGKIVPTFMQYTTPLDTFGGQQIGIGRLSPMNKPSFGEMYFDQYLFHVPFAGIWNEKLYPSGTEDFRDVITGQDTSYAWPTISRSEYKGDGSNLIEHYLGLGKIVSGGASIVASKIPRMVYNHICNKFFLQGSDSSEVNLITNANLIRANYKGEGYFKTLQSDVEQGATVTIDTSASTLDIREVTDAIRNQRYKELKEKYGEEMEDVLRLHGVNPSALAREEAQLVAKGTTTVGISEVLNTSDTDTGDYVGHGIVIGRMNVPKRLYLDWGILMGVAVLRPRQSIKNRVPKEFLVKTPEELYQRFYEDSSHWNVTGEEITTQAGDAARAAVWGYSEPYHYLRKVPDFVCGRLLDVDTFDDQFMIRETGDGSGIETKEAVDRVVDTQYDYMFQAADSVQPHCLLHCKNHVGKVSQIGPHNK